MCVCVIKWTPPKGVVMWCDSLIPTNAVSLHKERERERESESVCFLFCTVTVAETSSIADTIPKAACVVPHKFSVNA